MQQADFVAAATRPNTSSRLNQATSGENLSHQLSMMACRVPIDSRQETKKNNMEQSSPRSSSPGSIDKLANEGRYEIVSRLDAHGLLPKQCIYPYSINMNWTFDFENIVDLTNNCAEIENHLDKEFSSNCVQLAHNSLVGEYRYLQSSVFKTSHPESQWHLRVLIENQGNGESWLVVRLLADRLPGSLADGVLGQCSFQYAYVHHASSSGVKSNAEKYSSCAAAVLHGIWCEADQDGVFLLPLHSMPTCKGIQLNVNFEFGRLELSELLSDFVPLTWREDVCHKLTDLMRPATLLTSAAERRFGKKMGKLSTQLMRSKRSSMEIIWIVQNFSKVVDRLGRQLDDNCALLASPFFGDCKEAFLFQIFLLPRGKADSIESLQVQLHLHLSPQLLRLSQREFVKPFQMQYSTCVNGQYQQSSIALQEGNSHGCIFRLQHLFSQQSELKIKMKITFELPL